MSFFQVFQIIIESVFFGNQIISNAVHFSIMKHSIAIDIVAREEILNFRIGVTTSFQISTPFSKLN